MTVTTKLNKVEGLFAYVLKLFIDSDTCIFRRTNVSLKELT